MVQLRRWAGFGFFTGLGLLGLTFNACSDGSEDGNNATPDASSQGGTSSGGDLNLGGDPSSGGTNSGGSSRGGTSGGKGGSSNTAGSGSCQVVGASCDSHGDCCSASCDLDSNMCLRQVGTCKAAGDSCEAPTECCSGVCNGGECGSTICISDNEACGEDGECCGGRCEGAGGNGGSCVPLNPGCRTAGNSCTTHENCCSGLCDNGRCSGRPSFCAQTNDACAADADCCGGICAKASGVTLGTCTEPDAPGTTGCLLAGQLCGAGVTGAGGEGGAGPISVDCGGECCSRSCAPYRDTGVMICQPPSGCRPTGEICTQDTDCCNGPGLPGNESVTCVKEDGAPVGRCDNGNACRGSGAICKLAVTSCNAENNCCAGNVNSDPSVCQRDNLGIPRCTGTGDCTQGGSREGQACASSADCCGLPCLPNLDSANPPFICGPSCVDSGGVCTTDADCCAGLPCNLMPGSTRGTCGGDDPPDGGTGGMGTGGGGPDCAFVGQSCTDSGDCCNNLPCTAGTCRAQIF